jgi:hypothetical protein
MAPKFPSSLQRLDLPPDDDQVLLVFKNAASGWRSSTNRPEEIGGEADAEEAYVSREDWRAVCAVLLVHHAEEYAESDGAGAATVADQLVEGASTADEGENEYHQDAEPNADSDSDSDEYMEGPSTQRRTRTTAKLRARSSSSSSASSVGPPDPKKRRKLTARLTEACLATYTLFFPSASEKELPSQRIGIKDVQWLSKLIGTKLKGDEVRVVSSFLCRPTFPFYYLMSAPIFMNFLTYMFIEMLSEFSPSPDKSMSFAEFGDMMRAVKLV